MKKRLIILSFSILFVFVLINSAYAINKTWHVDDTYIGGGTDHILEQYLHFDGDVISSPGHEDDFNIHGMDVEMTDTTMKVNIQTKYTSGILSTDYGDLFINDTSSTDTLWDYVFDVTTGNLYDIRNAQGNILLSNDMGFESDPGTNQYRFNQAVAIDTTGLTAIGTGTAAKVGDFYSIAFDITALGLDLSNFELDLRWGETCANDVIEARIGTPEPGTMLLLGAGLTGLAGLRRRRMNADSRG